MSSSLTHRRSD